MRKAQASVVLELLKTLQEAHEMLKDGSLAHEEQINLLADCREFALHIIEHLNRVKNKECSATPLLQEYCEAISGSSAGADDAKSSKWFESHLIKIENSIKRELEPDKIEIVFFPYKYSMSDCFQSIWQAAISDPNCDVFICPIPYYDRLPDGELGTMHFEGDLYPSDLPLVDWQEYDVAARCPDIIFIHNPYDGSNFITSVHPDFYSHILKDCTDLLVYVPYYVSITDKERPLYFSYSAIIYAAKTIVQSKKLRQHLIRELTKDVQECNRNFYDDKILPLGSPKFDAIINMCNEDVHIPEDWAQLIVSKKVVLFATTLATLGEPTKFLNKLRGVFRIFNSRSDVTLLWRPHPLTEATFASKLPSLHHEYMEIVTNYKRERWGIYDDTADMRPAIAISDAYYGGPSSLLALYAVTGKPMMLENSQIMYENVAELEKDDEARHPHDALYSHSKKTHFNEIVDLALQESCEFTLNDYLDELLYAPADIRDTIRSTQLKMCGRFIEHADGTSGAAIYAEMKRLALEN